MLTSLALIFLAGLAAAALCQWCRLPRIIGMFFTGIALGPRFLGITPQEAALMGAVLAAVSPAIAVPRMVQLMDRHYGTEQSIPQLIMAGASCDDIFVIVLFSSFLGMVQGSGPRWTDFLDIPVSMILGVALGAAAGYILALFFETAYAHRHCVRSSMKVIIVLGTAFLLMVVETWLSDIVALSGLLAVLAILITAPLGALGIDLTYRRLLRRSSAETADVV